MICPSCKQELPFWTVVLMPKWSMKCFRCRYRFHVDAKDVEEKTPYWWRILWVSPVLLLFFFIALSITHSEPRTPPFNLLMWLFVSFLLAMLLATDWVGYIPAVLKARTVSGIDRRERLAKLCRAAAVMCVFLGLLLVTLNVSFGLVRRLAKVCIGLGVVLTVVAFVAERLGQHKQSGTASTEK